MRNFKKLLSLVLCMAVMLSVMVVGAGAAFSDQKEIKNTEAVDMCVALNIINGYTDGSFKPEGTITRAEACKMICIALNGGKEPVLGTNATASFTDIKGHWAEGYIEYCYSEGIVAGVGGGKFNPNGNVTGSQFAKMLLTALGFKADQEKFTGDAWEVNVNVKASQKKLYSDLASMDPSVALARDNAAQMVWNALNAKMVDYKYNLATDASGQLTSSLVNYDKDNTLLKEKFDAYNGTSAVMTQISYNENDKDWTYTFNAAFPVAGTTTTTTFTTDEDYSDLFRMNVKVVYTVKNGKVDEVFGMYADDSSVIASGVLGDITKPAATADKVKIDGTEYKLTGNANGVKFEKFIENAAFSSTLDQIDNVFTAHPDYKAWNFTLIDNTGDDKGDVIVVYPVTVAKVTYAGSKSISAGTEYKYEENIIADGIEKDDWVVITPDANNMADGAEIVKAEVVSGKVTGQKSGQVQVDGTWYDVAVMGTVNNNDSYDFVIYNGYVFNATVTAETSKDVLFVSAVDANPDLMVGENEGTIKARAYFTDGTNKQIVVSKVGGSKVTTSNKPAADTLYTYKISGDQYELVAVNNSTNKAGYDGYVTNVAAPSGTDVAAYNNKKFVASTASTNPASETAGASYAIADDAVVFVKSDSGIKVLTGKQVTAWGNTTFGVTGSALYAETNGIDYVKVATLINASATRPAANDDTQYGYLTADAYTTTYGEDDDAVIAYPIWNGSEETTVYEEYTGTPTLLAAGSVIRYKVDGDYVVKASGSTIYGDQSFATLAAITGFDYKSEGTIVYDTTVAAGGSTPKTLDKDCVFIAIDSANTAMHEGGMADIALAKSVSVGKHTANGYVVLDGSSDKVLAVIFDIPNNEIDVANNEFAD